MSILATNTPIPQYFGIDGSPLNSGNLFFGVSGQNPETSPTTVYWDAAGTQPAAQPISTINGYAARNGSPAAIYANGDYSLTVRDKRGRLVFTAPSAAQVSGMIMAIGQLASTTNAAQGAGMVGYGPTLAYPAGTVGAKLEQVQTSADIGGWGGQCVSIGINNIPLSNLGSGHVVVGYNNLLANTTGYSNKIFGNNCLQANTTGYFNYAFGDQVLQNVTTGSNNNGFGEYTLGYLTTGSVNSCFGDDNFRYMTTGSNNVSAGSQAGYNNLTGSWNTFIGTYAGRGTASPPDAGPGVGPSPTFCVAIGGQALYSGSGTLNTSGGYDSGYQTTGSNNTYWGANAGYSIVSGSNNVFIGKDSGNNAGQSNSASGVVAVGEGSYGGNNSVALGILSVASGGNGIALGQSATASGTSSLAIGAGTTASAVGAIAVGAGLNINTPNISAYGASTNLNNFFYGGMQPQLDNTFSVGQSGARWSVIWAATGSINTSDEREKQDIRVLDDAEERVAQRLKRLRKAYRWKEAFAKKGDKARIHVGWIAQDVIGAFEAEGLDAFAYGVCCHDSWDAQEIVHNAQTDDDGNVLVEAFTEKVPAGDRFSIRPDELVAFIVGAQ